MTSEQVSALGPGLASLMSMMQLQECAELYAAITTASCQLNTVPLLEVRKAFNNHLKSCLRMPRGGAGMGGSQQTGFEMELISMSGARELMAGWPNHESAQAGKRQSWELRTMDELAEHLALQEPETAGWGAFQGRPIALLPGHRTHKGVLLVSPPFTVTWAMRPDGTSTLAVRFPLAVWTEQDMMILPPDDAAGVPFYVDPAGSPGLHRDMFKTWGRLVAGELASRGFPFSLMARAHFPPQYASDGEGSISDATDGS